MIAVADPGIGRRATSGRWPSPRCGSTSRARRGKRVHPGPPKCANHGPLPNFSAKRRSPRDRAKGHHRRLGPRIGRRRTSGRCPCPRCGSTCSRRKISRRDDHDRAPDRPAAFVVGERLAQQRPLPGLELERLAFPAVLRLDQVRPAEVGEVPDFRSGRVGPPRRRSRRITLSSDLSGTCEHRPRI
jgi:hypothetical protein